MANLISKDDLRSLAASVDILKEPTDFFGQKLFPNVEEFSTKNVDYDIFEQNRRVFGYVMRNQEGQTVDKTGYETNSVEPPYLKPKMVVTNDDIQKRIEGSPLYVEGSQELSKFVQEFLGKRVYNELEVGIRRTILIQQVQAATTGIVTAKNARGKTLYTVNYGRNAALQASGIAGFTADKLALFRSRGTLVNKFVGKRTTDILLGADAVDAFHADQNVQRQLSKDWSKLGELGWTPDAIGAVWLGNAKGHNFWYCDDHWIDPADNVEKPVVEAKYALQFVEGLGSMYYGGLSLLGKTRGARQIKEWPVEDPEGIVVQLHSAPLAVTNLRNGAAYYQVLS